MKKIITLALGTLLVFGGCGKNRKMNRRLDGTWVTTSPTTYYFTSGDTRRLKFTQTGSNEGDVTLTTYTGGVEDDFVRSGTYTVTEKGTKISITGKGGSQQANNVVEFEISGTFSNVSKTAFTLEEKEKGTVTVSGGSSTSYSYSDLVSYRKE